MTNEELIAKIKAEIERRIALMSSFDGDYADRHMSAYRILLSFLSTLEKSEKPMNPEDAMKELDEKIALVKQRGTWDGVDVDKYMDEVRGRDPEKPMNQEGLEEELDKWRHNHFHGKRDENFSGEYLERTSQLDLAHHFAEWGAEHLKK